jgi:hypothetical protein
MQIVFHIALEQADEVERRPAFPGRERLPSASAEFVNPRYHIDRDANLHGVFVLQNVRVASMATQVARSADRAAVAPSFPHDASNSPS